MARITKGQFYNPRHHKLNVQIHLRTRGTKPTRAEVDDVLATLEQEQEVPDGWRFAFMRWNHAGEASDRWRRGNISDVNGGSLTQVWDALRDNMRIGIVRAKSGGDVWEIVIAMKY